VIRIENLSFTYPGAKQPNLQNINLHVDKGDFLAVIGNNGCGKSTLCKVLNGLIPHFFTGDFSGKAEIEGIDTTECTVGELAQKVGYVYQDFENQIVRPTVLDDASFACLNYAMADYRQRGKRALELVGLQKQEKDYIWQLSGGQKHLLALAGVVALTPEILILDEPIAQLDPHHAKMIYEVLKYLNETFDKTIIVIEHHTEFIARYCKNVMMMKEGMVLWKLPVKEGLNRTEELMASQIFPPQVTQAAQIFRDKEGQVNHMPLPTTLEEGKTYFSDIQYIQPPLRKLNEIKPKEPIVTFNKTGLSYRAVKGENRQVLEQLSLEVYKGEKIALIGNNGAGKSTLLKLITGLIKPLNGMVKVYGVSTKESSPEALAQKVSLVYQNPEEMFIKDSIRGDIEYAMKVRHKEDYMKRTEELMQMFNLKELEGRDGRLLSGGQMRRASLAVGIALNPAILLLDEPTASLDIATRREIIRMLETMKESLETVIIATHDMQLVAEWADRIIVLNEGHIIADGSRHEIFENKQILQRAGIEPPEIFEMGKQLHSKARCYSVNDFAEQFSIGHKEGQVDEAI
jgi:energy-coupling factor transport system ATP-binding protein